MYDVQTESHTPQPVELAPDSACFEKAKAHGEPIFVLRAQDVTADLVVDFWAIVQVRVREHMDHGHTMQRAVQLVREYFFLDSVNSPRYPTGIAKLDTAVTKAEAMRQWPNRKLAD